MAGMISGDAGPGIRRMLLLDVLGALAVNAGVFPILLWLVGLVPPSGPFGAGGGLSDAVKAVAFPVGLMTVIMTLVLRARFRRTPPGAVIVPQLFALVPRNLLLRTVLFIVLAVTILTPLRVGMCLLLGLYPLSELSFSGLNVASGIVIALVVMPPIFLAALADAK